MPQTRFWTLTLNNYTDNDEKNWAAVVPSGKASYICFQKEIAPSTGTPHLQGYIVFPKKIRLGGVKKALGSKSVHAVCSNGTPSHNRNYCTKSKTAVPNSFFEYGRLPPEPQRGARTDFEVFQKAVEDGMSCRKEARLRFPELVAKYPRWCYDILSDQDDIQIEEHVLFDWQQDLDQRLSKPPNDRTVIFVVDKAGGQGKTWFAKYYCKRNPDAQYMEPSKKADMAYTLQDDLRVLFFNVTRTNDSTSLDYLYSFVESVKDGMVFSPKYESRMKYYDKVHVVVMMNEEPNYNLLSADRYEIIELK